MVSGYEFLTFRLNLWQASSELAASTVVSEDTRYIDAGRESLNQYTDGNVFKYHVSCTDGKISIRMKIGINFIYGFHRRPI